MVTILATVYLFHSSFQCIQIYNYSDMLLRGWHRQLHFCMAYLHIRLYLFQLEDSSYFQKRMKEMKIKKRPIYSGI